MLWGGDINRFNPMPGKFEGVIGGPPCQAFSELARLNRAQGVEPKFGNLVPEFERCVFEAQPEWFIMENVEDAPDPLVCGYDVSSFVMVDVECGGITQRRRKINFGANWEAKPGWESENLQFDLRLCGDDGELAVTGSARAISTGGTIRIRDNGQEPAAGFSARLPVAEMARRQGLSEEFLKHSPFTESAKRQMIGNGVPLAMGRAIAKAVREATYGG